MRELPAFSREDFLEGTAPYEYVYQFANDQFTLNRVLERMAELAKKKCKVNGFKKFYQDYVKSQREASGLVIADSLTQFEGQELELNCGQWRADEGGITIEGPYGGEVEACNHPLIITERLVNIDSGVEKLRISYRKDKLWRSVIVEKKTLASNNAILDLANVGIAVNSENARYLVRYLHDLEALNYTAIPEKNSVSRLGWIGGEGFSPYVENLVFDGDASFRGFFESVASCGRYETWLALAREIRKRSVPARLILAASFASVLVPITEALSFFVHLWGSESGTGKTVALMLAASVWANPEAGKYIHTFNGTQVSLELSAGFVNHLPLILDEFQMLRNKKDFESIVYMLAEGVGKGRGAKSGGLKDVCTWRNCILTSGEMPITNYMTGAGAYNRIVEIECTERLFDDPMAVLSVIRNNYGHAGRRFVEALQTEGAAARAKELYLAYYKMITQSDTTEKQAMAGAVLLTADKLATEYIFQDNQALIYPDIALYLQTKTEVDINERAYDYICETISANITRFNPSAENGEVWGKLDNNHAYIIRSVFGRICEDGGYSDRAVLSWMARKGIVETSSQAKSGKSVPTVVTKLAGHPVRCVSMELKSADFSDDLVDYI